MPLVARLITGLAGSARRMAGDYAGALPWRLHRDLLYLWATFRLRYRPFKMLFFIIMLGIICTAIHWIGLDKVTPYLQNAVASIKYNTIRTVLLQTSGVIFSTLNILSFLSIFIMAMTLRRLIKQGHLEMLQLVPTKFRPSALYYAICLRYLPLAFVALLIIYLDPDPAKNPFNQYPFELGPRDEPKPDMWPLYWSGIYHISVLIFCPANLFMDLAIAFWLFVRWRVSHPTTIIAAILIAFVSPAILMLILEHVQLFVEERLRTGEGFFGMIAETITPGRYSGYTINDVSRSAHYLFTSALSIIIGLLALGNLDHRWSRTLRSTTADPILLKKID